MTRGVLTGRPDPRLHEGRAVVLVRGRVAAGPRGRRGAWWLGALGLCLGFAGCAGAWV